MIECWFITPSAVTVTVLCYNYITMDIRNNKYMYKEQFDQVPMCYIRTSDIRNNFEIHVQPCYSTLL